MIVCDVKDCHEDASRYRIQICRLANIDIRSVPDHAEVDLCSKHASELFTKVWDAVTIFRRNDPAGSMPEWRESTIGKNAKPRAMSKRKPKP